jgi:hypothetical protein
MLALHARRALDNPMVLTKIWLIVAGIYIWEFITSLGYEWDVIRGHRSYRWTIWVYSITRIAALMSVILNLITFNTSTAINCQAWVTLLWTSSCLSLCTGSLLIVLRVIAIWDRSKIVMAISIGLWVTNASVIILSVARIRAIWLPLVNTCGVTNLDASKPTLIALFGTDFLLLLIMLAGLLRLRRRGGGTLKLGRILWRQGIIWLSISTIAELLQMLFLVLNINVVLDSLFLLPAVVTLAISSTRLYRSLANFSSPPDSAQDWECPRSGRSISNNKPLSNVPSNRLEVTVHKAYEEHPTSEANHYVSYPSSDVPIADKPHEIHFDDNSTEDPVEK